ncbi:MAG: sigma-70 family RNA polymerase sigma factor [bacterium]
MDLKAEKELVKRAQNDPDAFSELYEANYSKIFGYILKRVADIEVAQDITSETFFKSLKNIKKFKWRNIPFSSWLYRIAGNEITDYYRKNKYTPVCLDKIPELAYFKTPYDEVAETEKQLEFKKDFLELNKKISGLPIKYQEVIALKFFEKKKIEEICLILGKKEGTVKSLIHRALKKLRQK